MVYIKKYLPITMVTIFTIALFYSIYRHIDGLGVFAIASGIIFFSFIMYNQRAVETFKLGNSKEPDSHDNVHPHKKPMSF